MIKWFFPSKERELITTSVDYYGSPSNVNLYLEDVLEVLSLTEDGSEKSIRRLKEKYKLENKYGDNLYVELETPKHAEYRDSIEHYPGETWCFTIKEVNRVYEKELEKKKAVRRINERKATRRKATSTTKFIRKSAKGHKET